MGCGAGWEAGMGSCCLMTIGVDLMVPSRATVAVHLNLIGKRSVLPEA